MVVDGFKVSLRIQKENGCLVSLFWWGDKEAFLEVHRFFVFLVWDEGEGEKGGEEAGDDGRGAGGSTAVVVVVGTWMRSSFFSTDGGSPCGFSFWFSSGACDVPSTCTSVHSGCCSGKSGEEEEEEEGGGGGGRR